MLFRKFNSLILFKTIKSFVSLWMCYINYLVHSFIQSLIYLFTTDILLSIASKMASQNKNKNVSSQIIILNLNNRRFGCVDRGSIEGWHDVWGQRRWHLFHQLSAYRPWSLQGQRPLRWQTHPRIALHCQDFAWRYVFYCLDNSFLLNDLDSY